MTLSETITSKHINKSVTINALVSGRSDVAYTVPKSIKLSCDRSEDSKKCKPCLVPSKQKQEIIIEAWDVLRFAETSEWHFKKIIADLTSLPCSKFSYSITKTQSLLKIFLSENGMNYTCYYIGTDLEINKAYELSGIIVTDPKTQNTTAIFTSAKKSLSAIDSFSITKESHNRLNEFCAPSDVGKIMEHLEALYRSYAFNITHIHDMEDLHFAIDLAFRSPLSFTFDGEYFHKGWADVAVIGDTRLGKGFVSEGLHRYFGVGEVVSGDNATFTGLIGGLKSVDRAWTVQWGKFPQNDKGLLIIDETSKLSRDTISRITRVRSEGIAEIHKIRSYTAPARVRTIFILNPGHGKSISQFPYGIMSILSVFRDPATVSRFDYVLVVSKDEADSKKMNSKKEKIHLMFSQELEQELIYWTWSRTNENIVFSENAVDRVYMFATELSNTYSFDVPLIQSENIRYKLAKIAACFAARVYSTKYSGRHLFVDACHVECAFMFLTWIYKKKSASYYSMSMIEKKVNDKLERNGLVNIARYFGVFHNSRLKLISSLLSTEHITMTDISDQTGISKHDCIEIITMLVRNKLIERQGFSYVKSPLFTEYLRDEIAKNIS